MTAVYCYCMVSAIVLCFVQTDVVTKTEKVRFCMDHSAIMIAGYAS